MLDRDLLSGIDKADFALLNAVSLDEWLAYLLNADVDISLIMNMPGHGLDETELIDHFFRLWRRGLIQCTSVESERTAVLDFELAQAQFKRTRDWPPNGDRALLYGLTASGGALWEALMEPRWTQFLREGAGDPPDRIWVFSGGSAL